MDALLAIVQCTSAARELGHAAAQSVVFIDDCGDLIALCGKVLPSTLTSLEENGGGENGEDATLELAQALTSALQSVHHALLALHEHQGNGLLVLMLEHSAAWLDFYRGIRVLTAQLVVLSGLIRQRRRRSKGTDDAFTAALKSLSAICTRARDAASLLGSDLPAFSRTAAACPAWSSHRCIAAAAQQCAASASPSPHQPNRTLTSSSASSSPPAKRYSWSPFRTSTTTSASGTPTAITADCSPAVGSPDGSASGRTGAAALADALPSLLTRIQTVLLYDSELEQLEQDRAYLKDRISELRAQQQQQQQQQQSAAAAASGPSATLVQCEVLLSAVELRVRAVREAENLQQNTCRQSSMGVAPSHGSASGQWGKNGAKGKTSVRTMAGALVVHEDGLRYPVLKRAGLAGVLLRSLSCFAAA